jgi:hypothetical protein
MATRLMEDVLGNTPYQWQKEVIGQTVPELYFQFAEAVRTKRSDCQKNMECIQRRTRKPQGVTGGDLGAATKREGRGAKLEGRIQVKENARVRR